MSLTNAKETDMEAALVAVSSKMGGIFGYLRRFGGNIIIILSIYAIIFSLHI